ncbi:MAG: hypothetical protein LBG28_01930 [Tannerella sp.]|jgi:hypothetical protein|nr:hypothetical protein [Tannerella sp.]
MKNKKYSRPVRFIPVPLMLTSVGTDRFLHTNAGIPVVNPPEHAPVFKYSVRQLYLSTILKRGIMPALNYLSCKNMDIPPRDASFPEHLPPYFNL